MIVVPAPARTQRVLALALGAAAALLLAIAPGGATALEGEHNKLPETCQGVAGAAWAANLIAARLTPTPYDFAPTAAAFASNWTLLLCPPQIVAPATVKLDPDEPDETSGPDADCYATVVQPTTKARYDNLVGITTQKLSNWGKLGTPRAFHFNKSADVRILGPDTIDADGNQRLDDELQTERDGDNDVLRVPVGYNTYVYRADTLISLSDLAFIYIPKTPPGSLPYKALIGEVPRLSLAAINIYRALSGSVDSVERAGRNFLLDEILGFKLRHSEFGVFDDVFNQDTQSIWVYDEVPPVISTHTDVSTLPDAVRAVLSYDAARDVYFLEAIHAGGIQAEVGIGFLERLLDYSDHCDRPVTLSNDGGGDADFWATGSRVSLRWTASDPGPVAPSGGVNEASLVQNIEIRDSYPPVLLAPPSQVIEVPSGTTEATVEIGSPRAYDLADLTPEVDNDAPDDSFGLGLTEVTWTASDGFNESRAVQLINIKEEGTNTAPFADPQTVEARTDEPVEIVLTGSDADYHPSVDRFDPLTFSIIDKPDHGAFVAPLLPYFIDDYRLEASALRFADEPWQQDPRQYCIDRAANPRLVDGPASWEMGYPYFATWMAVDDAGNTIVQDAGGMQCSEGDLMSTPRIALFDAEQNFVDSTGAPSGNIEDIYWHYDTGWIYVAVSDTQGDDYVHVYDRNLERVQRYDMSKGGFPAAFTSRIRTVTVDGRGILYVADERRVNAYRQSSDTTDTERPEAGDVFLGEVYRAGLTMESMTADSAGNLYVGTGNRIEKIGAGRLDGSGIFLPGPFVGWLGACTANLTSEYACDTPHQRSVGFACTDELCDRSGGISDDQPGQFRDARGIQVDPNDVLYVSDYGNSRVQRFTPDGLFAGEAKSQGVGYGFLLGDFGRPDDIEVNADHFYILNRDAKLLHVFETTPITPVDDGSARVTYRSDAGFVGVDRFRFGVTDGLDSAEADVTIDVARNFRPPEVPVSGQPFVAGVSFEDQRAEFVLPGIDPDGDFDTLTAELVTAPSHGDVMFDGLVATYVPDVDYAGPDTFSYRVADGRDTSAQDGTVELIVDPVEDRPTIDAQAELDVNVGFPVFHRVDVFDPDANETLLVTIDWGDGHATAEGHFEIGGIPIAPEDAMNPDGTLRDGVEVTGPILGVDPMGRGVLIADHVYTRAGAYSIESCVSDRAEINRKTMTKYLSGASKTECTTTSVDVRLAAELAIEVEAPDGPQTPGAEVTFAVTLRNAEFALEPDDPRFAELPATGMPITGLEVDGELTPHLALGSATSMQLGCMQQDTQAFACDLAEIPYGGEATLEVAAVLSPMAPGRAEPGLAIEGEWLDMPEPVVGGATFQVASSGEAPQVSALSPTSGKPAGFEEVTLEGENFEAGMRVLFGGRPGTQVRAVDSETLKVLAPAQSPGTVDITVLNFDDQSGQLADAYTYESSDGAGDGGTSGGGGTGGGGGGTGGGGGGTGGGGGGAGGGGGSTGGGSGGGGGSADLGLIALLLGLLLVSRGHARSRRRARCSDALRLLPVTAVAVPSRQKCSVPDHRSSSPQCCRQAAAHERYGCRYPPEPRPPLAHRDTNH